MKIFLTYSVSGQLSGSHSCLAGKFKIPEAERPECAVVFKIVTTESLGVWHRVTQSYSCVKIMFAFYSVYHPA